MNKHVSVIIPVYNAEKYLEKCLDSIINQTLKDIEIICVDDCSCDNSLNILNNYAKKDKRLKVIHCDSNGGESKARNIGLDNATGEYLGFVDNDDYIDSDFYEKLYAKALETNADIVKGQVEIKDYSGNIKYRNLNSLIRENNSKLYFTDLWWTAIYKAETIKANNIRFLEGYKLGGDILFLNEALLKSDKLELIDDTYYHYIRREDSGDSLILSQEKVESLFSILEKIVNNTLAAKTNDHSGTERVCNWCFDMIVQYAFRLKTIDNLKLCIDKLFIMYNIINNKVKIEYLNRYPIIKNYLNNNDKDGLLNFYIKNDTLQKLILANLRYIHLNNKPEIKNVTQK